MWKELITQVCRPAWTLNPHISKFEMALVFFLSDTYLLLQNMYKAANQFSKVWKYNSFSVFAKTRNISMFEKVVNLSKIKIPYLKVKSPLCAETFTYLINCQNPLRNSRIVPVQFRNCTTKWEFLLCAGQFRNCTDSHFAPNIYTHIHTYHMK